MFIKRKAKSTYCPFLWDATFIDEKGDVYSCCHNKPEVLGSIYQERLSDICNNGIIRRLRQASLDGRLECYRNCTILDKDEAVQRKTALTIDYKEQKILKILFGEGCNIRCIMCPQDHRSRLSLDFERMIDNLDISPFESIEIQGGEPLFIPSAKTFFDYVASRNKQISFLTNGMLVDDEWAEKIARHSSFIYFSLNAATRETHELVNKGSRWKRVLLNIQRIREARDKLDTDVRIWGHMTIVHGNLGEIAAFIRSFRQFGFDSIDFGYAAGVLMHLRTHPWRRRKLRREIAAAINECDDPSLILVNRLKLLGVV